MQNTKWTKKEDIKREWYIIDAKDRILGHVATKVASLLIGKGKVNQSPNMDCGDHVVIINSAHIKLTRNKEVKKMYYSHTTYPGGFKEIRFDKLLAKDPTAPIRKAIDKMLPKNKLRDGMLKRLYVYSDANHGHEAQTPKPINL
ncbi:MAG: 50S ribosomal protein L13 [candidate division WS6 bacterium GW2011_GWF2_39_15]|uniref:Large ribosomal subunit protein uL13 n=1 Tax=candidate division WS6 bacterium GW2011_GWF2_39_15 TaxID=1619100 RepID=A0A0G0MRB0_9BACT|nr:MAG: 50S ribosomal protein L13 [candidate division WS6 bacterium GW2011_GWF2_39_15]